MKKHVYFFISVFIISSLDGMKRGVDHVYEDLEDGLNPLDDRLIKAKADSFCSLVEPVNCKALSTGLPSFSMQGVFNYQATLVQDPTGLSTKKAEDKKNNDTLCYLKSYFKRLFLYDHIRDYYHCLPPCLILYMMNLNAEHSLHVRSKQKDDFGFKIHSDLLRSLPVLMLTIKRNGESGQSVYIAKVVTDTSGNNIVHVGFEQGFHYKKKEIVNNVLKNILYCANKYPDFLHNIAKSCHEMYSYACTLSMFQRCEKIQKILNFDNDQEVVRVYTADLNELGGFVEKPVVCEYPFKASKHEKILYFPLNHSKPAGVFTPSTLVPDDVLVKLNYIKY